MTAAGEEIEKKGELVFISYANEKVDTTKSDRQVADKVYSALQSKGIRGWVAHKDIAPGMNWPDEISKAISQSRIMVLVLSSNTQKSPFVIKEVTQAVAESIIIIPFCIEDVSLEGGLKLLLSNAQRINAFPRLQKKHLDKLGETVLIHLGKEPGIPAKKEKLKEPFRENQAKSDVKEIKAVKEKPKESADMPAYVKDVLAKANKVNKNKNGYWDGGYVKEELKPGNVYDVAFLSVDIEGYSQIVRKYKQTPALTEKLISHFHDFSLRIVKLNEGDIFSWYGEGGVFIFWGERYSERCILAGLKMLKELDAFNLDREQNPLSEPISFRISANYALIKYLKNKKTFSSDALNLTVKLQEKYTNNGEFCITTALLDGLDSRFTNIFLFKGRFEGEPIYSHVTVKEDTKITENKMSFLLETCRKYENQVKHLFQKKSGLSQEDLEQISASFDLICSSLETFCRWFEMIDEKWSIDFLKHAFDIASALLTHESKVWEIIDKTYRQLPKTSTYFREYEEVVVNVCASRRAKPVTLLNRIREELQRKIEGTDVTTQTEEHEKKFTDKIKHFLSSDELDEEIALFDLLLNFETELLNYIFKESSKEKQIPIVEKLWELADLLLQHHLYFHGSIQRRRGKKILTILSEEPVKDERFSALNELLSQVEVDNNDIVNRKFERFQSSSYSQEKFTEVVWKSLSLGHPNQKTRQFACRKLSVGSVLQIIARNRVQVDLIYYIGNRFTKSTKDDYKKIFFDCTRAKICQAITEAKSKESLLRILNLFKLFKEFSFLAETLYFERYDEMLSRFIEKVKQMGMTISYLEDYRTKLDKLRQEKGVPHGSIPKIDIKRLPPHIRRRLASEAPYLDIFITDIDHRVARETLRHIKNDNVKKVLQNTEINLQLMLEILKKREFFKNQDVLTAALKNPKCNAEFAKNQMGNYGRTEQSKRALFSIARDAKDRDIKILARQKIKQHGWHFKVV